MDLYDDKSLILWATWDCHVSRMVYDLHGVVKDLHIENSIYPIIYKLMNFLMSHNDLSLNKSELSLKMTILGVDHIKKRKLHLSDVRFGGRRRRMRKIVYICPMKKKMHFWDISLGGRPNRKKSNKRNVRLFESSRALQKQSNQAFINMPLGFCGKRDQYFGRRSRIIKKVTIICR